jgi:hypothetical protein
MGKSKEKKRVSAAVRALHEELGTLSTAEQIVKASRHCSMIRNTAECQFKDKVWRAYIRQHCDHKPVWSEISIYRLVNQTSHFFLSDQDRSILVSDDLCHALELWMFLAAVDKLPLLLQGDHYNIVVALKERGASPAEVFRTYMNVRKVWAGFDKWTKKHINDMRYAIYKVVLQVRRQLESDEPRGHGTMPSIANRKLASIANPL